MDEGNIANAMQFPWRCTFYNGRHVELIWRFKITRNHLIGKIADQVIDNLRKGGDINDKPVGEVVYRKPSLGDINGKTLDEIISF